MAVLLVTKWCRTAYNESLHSLQQKKVSVQLSIKGATYYLQAPFKKGTTQPCFDGRLL